MAMPLYYQDAQYGGHVCLVENYFTIAEYYTYISLAHPSTVLCKNNAQDQKANSEAESWTQPHPPWSEEMGPRYHWDVSTPVT